MAGPFFGKVVNICLRPEPEQGYTLYKQKYPLIDIVVRNSRILYVSLSFIVPIAWSSSSDISVDM